MVERTAVVVPVNELDLPALRREQAELTDEVLELDSQLSSKKNDFMSRRLKPEEYYEWRAKAVDAKAWRTRRLTLIKAEVAERALVDREVNRTETGTWHRRKAHALRMALEEVEKLLDTGQDTQAMTVVKSALADDRAS